MPNSIVLSRFTFSSISIVYKFTGIIWFHILISFNSPTHSTVSQIQFYYLLSRSYLILQSQHIQQWNKFNSLIFFTSYLIQQFHVFKSATKSMVFSWFTFSSLSTVALIQKCHKLSCIIYFHVHISFNSPTHSTVSQIQLYYLFHVHISFYSPNIFNNETNSTVLSFLHHILFNSSMYSKVQQSQWSFLGLHSHLFQQSHIFNHVTNSTVLPRFTFSSISKVYKFTGLIWFHSLISFNSPTHSTVSQIQFYYLLSRSYLILQSQHIQQWNKFNSLIFFTSYLIQQFHVFKSATKSMVFSWFTFSSLSTVALIQQCHKFGSII